MKTERTKRLPPFYTHVIGSLPRPKMVLDLLHSRNQMDENDYHKAMDEMVLFAIRLQERAGLDVVSDGEWRRSQYIAEFLNRIGGFKKVRKFIHHGEEKLTDVIVDKIEAGDPVFFRDAKFLAQSSHRLTKFALPSPFLIATRYWHEDYSTKAYPTREDFIDELSIILYHEAKSLIEAGIDIIQLDDPALTYFCDEKVLKGDTHDDRLKQNWDINRQMPHAVQAINRIVDGLQAEFHLHCCHSVYKRMSDVNGNYQPILPWLKNAKIDQVNLEFAYHGTGDITDLNHLPDNLNVGMGVVDVRTENFQTVEDIAVIAEDGAKMIAPKRIAMNPDCGFSPDAGEPPTVDEAYLKLKNMCLASKKLQALNLT